MLIILYVGFTKYFDDVSKQLNRSMGPPQQTGAWRSRMRRVELYIVYSISVLFRYS
ncbi:hypothetical protein D1BOALGB6SA_8875 [Olavius sp. associated proteobacterium Delta 1]|nr:hypothetical protein D1BOALGB6SA_8875 [Olavius sp. associated proteobacterium Delta 1]